MIALVVLGIVLVIWHNTSENNCNDNGVIGYCCQVQEQKLVNEGKQPDYVCPG